MANIVSYRQKLIELARIYKIDKVFNPNYKYTTYEIEIILLKNNVPIPSRRGYISHKLINEVYNPSYQAIKSFLSINFNINKFFKLFYKRLKKQFSININIKKYPKILFNYVNSYFKFIISSIVNYYKSIVFNIFSFFKTLSRMVVDVLNDIYNFQIREKILKNIITKTAYASFAIILVLSGVYIKNLVTDVDSLKIALDIKSDKTTNDKKLKRKEVVKVPENIKKNKTKNSSKLPEDKKFSNSDGDYSLNTQTVLNLFEDLEYDLDRVRNKKKVKPIYFTRLPKDLDTIKSVKEKKETFLQILLPLVVAENAKIKEDREYLLKILKENESVENRKWLNKKYKAYKVKNKNIDDLIEKIDIIPTSIALAQAAKESGWGTSRFALEGNAIYGQWTWNGDGIEPLEKTKDQNHKILKFPLLRASVKAYITNLNTHRGYKSFRTKRSELRKQNKKLAGIELIHELDNYAQTGKEYTKILEKIIKQNDLDELESVTIDDFKESNQLKL